MKPEQAQRLRQGRESAGYTQKDAAHHLNVAESTYRAWEKPDGSEPASASKFVEVARLFNISLDWWLAGKKCGPSLSRDEYDMLRHYRTLNSAPKKALKVIVDHINK